MTDQGATARSPIVGDGHAPVLPNNFQVEGNHAFSGHVGTARSRAMRSMATRAGKSGVDMHRVLTPTGRAVDRRKIVALTAQSIRTVHAEIRIGEQIRDPLAGSRSLAEFIAALQNMRPF